MVFCVMIIVRSTAHAERRHASRAEEVHRDGTHCGRQQSGLLARPLRLHSKLQTEREGCRCSLLQRCCPFGHATAAISLMWVGVITPGIQNGPWPLGLTFFFAKHSCVFGMHVKMPRGKSLEASFRLSMICRMSEWPYASLAGMFQRARV